MKIDEMIERKMVYLVAFYEGWILCHVITIAIGWTGPTTNCVAFMVGVISIIIIMIVRKFKKGWENTLLIMFVKKFNEYLNK